MSKKIVHVVGTGTIGEPLIGILSVHKEEFGIDEVTFHKNSPRATDRPKLAQLTRRGAQLCANPKKAEEFKKLGLEVAYSGEEAVKRATVVIDCTEIGAPPPMATPPMWIWRLGRRVAIKSVVIEVSSMPCL